MRFFIDLAYNGQSFHGWQKQPNAITVEETIEDCFAQIFSRKIALVGAGRTDTGVHARQLVAHFDIDQSIEVEHLKYKLNRMLPSTVSVQEIYRVKADAHARFDALWRQYKYYLSTKKNPFAHDFSGYLPVSVDVELMNEACKIIKQHRDFECFSKVKTDVKTYNCIVKEAFWEEIDNQLVFSITANRFLRNMVRAIVGTLLEIGAGKKSVAMLTEILESKNRCRAGKSVAAQGLFLEQIMYPENIKIN